MIIVRLLSPGPWLVGTTKVYSGVGADIVMESLTLKIPQFGYRSVFGTWSLANPVRKVEFELGCRNRTANLPQASAGRGFRRQLVKSLD